MKRITGIVLALLLLCALSSYASVLDIGGCDPDSIGPTDGMGKTGGNVADTTEAVFVGGYKWIRAWATASTVDSCRIVAQKSWDGINWTGKDSTSTSIAASHAILYDSLYVRGIIRIPVPPAPWMRWIAKTTYTVDGDSLYTKIKGFKMHVTGGEN